MTPRVVSASATVSSRLRSAITSIRSRSRVDFATLGRAPLRLILGNRRVNVSRPSNRGSNPKNCSAPMLQSPMVLPQTSSLLRGLNATVPSSEMNRTRKRQLRNVDVPKVGLRSLGLQARGLEDEVDDGHSVVSEDDMVLVDQREEEAQAELECYQNSRVGTDSEGSCMRTFNGHTKAVTALYFEDECSVHRTRICAHHGYPLGHLPPTGRSTWYPDAVVWDCRCHGVFAVPIPPCADGSWHMYQNFVGGVQSWGYGFVNGSGDGAVRMWDRPVTCLQFDEIHIVTGSLDKTIRIWDVCSSGVFETVKYHHGVVALQYDTRKIVAATGENGVEIYNHTKMLHSTLWTNGHTRPVDLLRYVNHFLRVSEPISCGGFTDTLK